MASLGIINQDRQPGTTELHIYCKYTHESTSQYRTTTDWLGDWTLNGELVPAWLLLV